jgi:hypothetical protein
MEKATAVGLTWRCAIPPTARAVDVVIVEVEFLVRVPPTCVPGPPEQVVDTQGTGHKNTVKLGFPGDLGTVTTKDSATRGTFPLLVTSDSWEVFAVKVIDVTEAVIPQTAEATDSVPIVLPPTLEASAMEGRRATPRSRTTAADAVLQAVARTRHVIGRQPLPVGDDANNLHRTWRSSVECLVAHHLHRLPSPVA